MRATPLLLGCLLGLGAIANAMAAGTTAASGMGSTGSSYNCTDHSAEHGTDHQTSSASGDALNIPRAASHAAVSPSNRSSSANATDDSPVHASGGGDVPSENSSRGSSGLSWQSLLPGSIQ
jgi:hypothetical protein